MVEIKLDADALRPLVELVASEVITQLRANEDRLGDKLGYSETEASAALGVSRTTLRDLRRGGESIGVKIGKGYVYGREELLGLLRKMRRP